MDRGLSETSTKHDPSVMDMRGWFHADSEGRYYLRTLHPLGYLIPMDGPVGDMMAAEISDNALFFVGSLDSSRLVVSLDRK